jgi:hypothetical protein
MPDTSPDMADDRRPPLAAVEKYELTPDESEMLTPLGRDFIRRRFDKLAERDPRTLAMRYRVDYLDAATGRWTVQSPNSSHRPFASEGKRDQYLARLQAKQRTLYAIAKGLH